MTQCEAIYKYGIILQRVTYSSYDENITMGLYNLFNIAVFSVRFLVLMCTAQDNPFTTTYVTLILLINVCI